MGWDQRYDERKFNTDERFMVTALDRWGWSMMAANAQEHREKSNDPAL